MSLPPNWALLPLAWPDAPAIDEAIYPDEYLDFWADRYVARGYVYRDVSLMQFLANPQRYEHDERYTDPLPLLGRQRRIQRRLIDAEHAARAGRRAGEPLDLSSVARP